MTEMKNTVLLIFALVCFLAVFATALGDNEADLLERVEKALENTIKAKKTLHQDGNDVGQLVVLQRELQLRDAMENFIERETDDERESLLLELREELENLKATLERLKVNKRQWCWWCDTGSKLKPDDDCKDKKQKKCDSKTVDIKPSI